MDRDLESRTAAGFMGVTQLIVTSKFKVPSEKRNSQGTDTLFNVSPAILKNLNQEIHFHVLSAY